MKLRNTYSSDLRESLTVVEAFESVHNKPWLHTATESNGVCLIIVF